LIIIVPLWFIIPKIFEQIFEVFRYLQTFDIANTIKTLFPGATDSFVTQITAVFSTITSKFASSAMNGILNTFFQLPTLALNVLVAGFVFFFALRDKDKLRDFVEGLSPLSKAKEGLFIQQFKDITDAIVYGQVVIGVIQGTLAGLSFFLFGVPNAFVLTILAIVFAIIPMVGPMVVWIPVTFYLFATAPPWVVILYLLYNIILVSTIDNVIRSYLISKKSRISTAIIIVGMVGGFLLLGFLGLIIGPLIVAYLVIFLEAYKDKKWANLFAEE
jgi:predicted PurR-regulated permease PerM